MGVTQVASAVAAVDFTVAEVFMPVVVVFMVEAVAIDKEPPA
jgi:hypothetical protein